MISIHLLICLIIQSFHCESFLKVVSHVNSDTVKYKTKSVCKKRRVKYRFQIFEVRYRAPNGLLLNLLKFLQLTPRGARNRHQGSLTLKEDVTLTFFALQGDEDAVNEHIGEY